jgi:hypothetical protein
MQVYRMVPEETEGSMNGEERHSRIVHGIGIVQDAFAQLEEDVRAMYEGQEYKDLHFKTFRDYFEARLLKFVRDMGSRPLRAMCAEFLMAEEKSQSKVAEILGVSQDTISKDLARRGVESDPSHGGRPEGTEPSPPARRGARPPDGSPKKEKRAKIVDDSAEEEELAELEASVGEDLDENRMVTDVRLLCYRLAKALDVLHERGIPEDDETRQGLLTSVELVMPALEWVKGVCSSELDDELRNLDG